MRATGYAMEQWDERILKTVRLPDELAEEDLLAIAGIHFAGIKREYLLYIVGKVAATERNYCSDIAKIAALARDTASDAGREVPTLADIDDAISDVLPPAMHAPSKPRAEALQTPPKARATRPAASGDFQPPKPRQTNFEPTLEEHVSPALAE